MADTADPLLDAVEDYVARSLMPLARKILDLEHQLQQRVSEPGAPGRNGVDGKDAEPVDYDRIGTMIKVWFASAAGLDGKDGEPGRPGQDAVVDYDAINARIAAAVADQVAKIPPAKDGIDGKAGKDGEQGPPGAAGAPGERGRDGDAGAPGERGSDGEKGLDGRDGRDAIDGLVGIKADIENERELVVSFIRSNGVRTTLREALPIPIFRGVYQDGHKYARGDNVTKNGCQWTCMADTGAAPPSADWVQSTKAGRDGRDK